MNSDSLSSDDARDASISVPTNKLPDPGTSFCSFNHRSRASEYSLSSKICKATLFGLLAILSCLSGVVLGGLLSGFDQGHERGWKSIGPPNAAITRLAVETHTTARKAQGASARLIYAQTPEKVLVFADGENWKSLSTPPSWSESEWFLLQGENGIRALAMTNGESIEFSYGMNPRTSDLDGLSNNWRLFEVENCHTRPTTLYAAVEEKTHADDKPDLLLKSTNGGLSWIPERGWSHLSSPSSLFEIRVDPENADAVFLVFDIGGASALAKTTDGGVTWRSTVFRDARFDYLDLTYAPSNPRTVYVLAKTRGITIVYRSSNGLESVVRKSRLKSVYTLAVDPSDAEHLFALAYPHQLIESRDGGETWDTVNTSELGKNVALCMAMDTGGIIYLGTARNGIFMREPPRDVPRPAHPPALATTETTRTKTEDTNNPPTQGAAVPTGWKK